MNPVGIIIIVVILLAFMIVLFIQIIERHKINLPQSIDEIHILDVFILDIDECFHDVRVISMDQKAKTVTFKITDSTESHDDEMTLLNEDFLNSIHKRS